MSSDSTDPWTVLAVIGCINFPSCISFPATLGIERSEFPYERNYWPIYGSKITSDSGGVLKTIIGPKNTL
jgi:hypothetical protein